MNNKVYLASDDEIADIARALSSKLRRNIIKLLGEKKMNVGEIAKALGIPQSTCVVNIQLLEKANIVKTEQQAASKGVQKICYIPYQEVVLPLLPESHLEEDHFITTEMPIGLYTDCQVSAPCGLITESEIIGYFDQADSFFNPKRATAGLLWFTKGFCEYRFPRPFSISSFKVKSISISMELCSEYPGFNNDWPSDITLWLNGKEVGTWRSPGDCGSTYGRLTPHWWDLMNTQFGFIKTWKITPEGSFIDGEPSGSLTLKDIDYNNCNFFMVRVGIKEDAEFCGGINIFGSSYGNYEQDIVFKFEIDK
ncbi:helix-turn-helix domain-containing protein [Oceanispirochaeta sp.]|jgi:predicted transcriptional regulator|uniref:ArsR/SmtB family transcription factor n=1 Tax=Oceanispirochaeta sp. TaxID=2035350 RepID=UPI00263A2069|nr:helix-turn-helix domain-containing protein [Oceanispirochaeta sp.]MDA3956723.1 helix-turn-helix domain-containing protein [Oceanispirochaeta sp.]